MRLAILANHGTIGGGEVMALQMAVCAERLGVPCSIVGPGGSELEQTAADLDLAYVALAAEHRSNYPRSLAVWSHRQRDTLLWGNGAKAALATTFARSASVVHLHQRPSRLQAAVLAPARARASVTFVPSRSMQQAVSGSLVLSNWTEDPTELQPMPPDQPLRVGFIGRLSTRKGADVLAKAVHIMRADHDLDAELVVAGDDRFVAPEEYQPVAAALADLGDAVHLLGWVPRAEFYAQVDIVVVPSVWAEPFGLVAAEALAHRKTLVVTRAGALPEIVGEDHPWMVTPGDATALAGALMNTLSNERQRVAAIDLGYKRWEGHFSPRTGERRVADVCDLLGLC